MNAVGIDVSQGKSTVTIRILGNVGAYASLRYPTHSVCHKLPNQAYPKS